MKTTTFLKSLTIAAAAAFFGSCQQLYVETQPEVEVKMVTDVREAYNFSGTNPQPATFSISSTTPWEITGYENADWLNVKPSSSALSSLSADVTITAAVNETYEERSATLTLKGEGIDQTWTVQVKQSKKSKIFVQPVGEEFASVESSLSFTIETNLDWEVRSADSWLTFDKTSGKGTGAVETITATAAANPGTERTTTVTITAGNDTETFEVTQKGGFKFYVQPISETFASSESSLSFTVETNLDWEVRSADAWLTFDKTSGKGTGAVETITATVTANTGVERTTTVTVTAGSETKTFDVVQAGGMTFNVAPADTTGISYAGGEILLDVEASMDWTVKADAEWLTVEKVSDTQVKVSAPANCAFADRAAVVTVTGGDLEGQVEVTQASVFELDGAELLEDGSVKLDGANGARINIKEGLRYFTATLSVKEISFGDEGQFWFFSETDGDFGNWMSVGKFRLRTNNGSVSNYDNTYYDDDMSVEFLGTMTKYEFTVTPDAETEGNGKFLFTVNDTTIESHSWASPFAGNDTTFEWWFGFYSSVSDGTYYVIDSCTITPIAE